jgi:hypothetical protein
MLSRIAAAASGEICCFVIIFMSISALAEGMALAAVIGFLKVLYVFFGF